MNKKTIKCIIMSAASSILMGIGTAFYIQSKLGSSAIASLEEGIVVYFNNISLSTCSLLVNSFFLICDFFVNIKAIKVGTFLSPFCISLGVKIGCLIIPSANNIVYRVVVLIIGLIVASMGVGLAVNSNGGSGPYDTLCLEVGKKLNCQYKTVHLVIDIAMFIFGILMGGSYGVGTIVAVAVQGSISQYFIKLFEKYK